MTKEITIEKIKSQGGQNVMFVHQGKGNQGQGGNTH